MFPITHAEVIHRRCPIAKPTPVSFGVRTERHSVAIRLKDDRGNHGLGETWVNYPLWAPSERIAALNEGFLPYLQGKDVDDIPQFMGDMFATFLGQARQSGTIALLVEALCGIEVALWDLKAKRQDIPLRHLLFPDAVDELNVYASGIVAPLPVEQIQALLDQGVQCFKLKTGFGDDNDRKNIDAMKKIIGDQARLACDSNRKWTFDQAAQWLPIMRDYNIAWFEEALSIDDEHRYSELKNIAEIPLSAGENVLTVPGAGAGDFSTLAVDILQPDITKYNAIHNTLAVIAHAQENNKRCFLHFLGSAPGLAATAQIAAGIPEHMLELDINENPLRTDYFAQGFPIEDGRLKLPSEPGLGWN